MTAAGLLVMRTLVARPTTRGAENGIGGAGCGTPEAGLGIWWAGHVPMILSPRTAAGVPIAFLLSLSLSVQLDDGALDLDGPGAFDLHGGALEVEGGGRL